MGGFSASAAGRAAPNAEALSRLSISFFAIFGALLSAAAIGDGRPASASVLLTFLGAFQEPRPPAATLAAVAFVTRPFFAFVVPGRLRPRGAGCV